MSLDTAVAMITLADARTYLKITAVDAVTDNILNDLINESSVFVTTYVGRKFLQATYTEYYDGEGSDKLILNNFPVTSITSLYDDSARTFGAASLIAAENYILDGAAGILRVWNGKPSFFPGVANVKITYVAGYAVAAIPYDVQLAVRLIVANQYKHRYVNQRFGISSETIADRTIQFQDVALPAEAKQILEHHRAVSNFARGF